MALALKKDLAGTYKRETILNVGLLSKLQPLFPELNVIIFKENALEKPTQNLFNNLTYYLVSIIDSQMHASFTWPLYDTKAERAYRSEISKFINNYSSKGLLAPVPSSYLVNPSSYKITVLLYQLSQLAVHVMAKTGMNESQKAKYIVMTERYKNQKDSDFVVFINKETENMQNNFSNYISKRRIIENAAELLRNKIKNMERKLCVLKCQEYINNLVDNYLNTHNIEEVQKTEILKIKDVHDKTNFFEYWLINLDTQINDMEETWEKILNPYLDLCRRTYQQTEDIIKRFTGQVDKSMYTIEYDPKSDRICTDELEAQVNSEQKFILKNLEINGKLNFPNLLRAYIISISFILKNNEIGNEIFKFNEYLDVSNQSYNEVVLSFRSLIDRIFNADTKLQQPSLTYNNVTSITDYPEMPPIPDISDLKIHKIQNHVTEIYTPLHVNKHQLNLLRRTNKSSIKPVNRNFAPIYQAPRDDFLKSLISCRVSAYDHANVSQISHDKSVITSHKASETIAECSTGFTKQQLIRLLSTKKSSSSKKFRNKQERPTIKKKGALFDESIMSNESNGLFRSYSSPNLFENRERRTINRIPGRKLSIMKEDSPSQFNMTGITSLDIDSNFNTPQGIAESSRKEIDTSNTPVIHVTDVAEERINNVLCNMTNEIGNVISPILEVSPLMEVSPILEVAPNVDLSKNNQDDMQLLKPETPRTNLQPIKKTSSLEKIINRFKKVRATIIPPEYDVIRTTVKEKDIMKYIDTNRVLLPDLLSPSCSNNIKHNENLSYLDQICIDMDKAVSRRPRESLGTALGVDNTFLDQFDLTD